MAFAVPVRPRPRRAIARAVAGLFVSELVISDEMLDITMGQPKLTPPRSREGGSQRTSCARPSHHLRFLRRLAVRRRKTGSYGTKQLAADMSPYNYFRGTQNTKITSMSGREYLDVTMKKGCYGTDSSKGCGLYGRAPVIGSGTQTVTMEYTCALLTRMLGQAWPQRDM